MLKMPYAFARKRVVKVPYNVSGQASQGKRIVIVLLMFIASLILASGIGLSIYSILTGSSVLVMGNDIPGFVFGLLMCFLGIRYIQSVIKLKRDLEQSQEKFSWQNFRRQHQKSR